MTKATVLPGIDDDTVAGRLRETSTSKSKEGKQQREYAFRIEVDGSKIGTTQWLTFGEIRKRMKPFECCGTSIPHFPDGSFHGTKDHVHNTDNAKQRSEDLAEYLTAVLRTDVIGYAILEEKFPFVEESKGKCVAAFQEIHIENTERLDSMLKQHKSDREYAQEYNKTANADDPVPFLKFNDEKTFTLRDLNFNTFGKDEVLTVVGPNGFDWFQWIHMDEKRIKTTDFDSMKKHQSALCTMKGEPLLLFKEKFEWRNYYCELSRYANGEIVPLCSVKNIWDANSPPAKNPYRIKLLGPLCGSKNHKVIQTSGKWPGNFIMANKSVKKPFATCYKKMFAMLTSMVGGKNKDAILEFYLNVSPGEDCLLFIGIASAIGRIVYEIDQYTEGKNWHNF